MALKNIVSYLENRLNGLNICNNLIGYVQGVFIPKIVEDVLLKVMYRGVPMTKQASIEKGDTGF